MTAGAARAPSPQRAAPVADTATPLSSLDAQFHDMCRLKNTQKKSDLFLLVEGLPPTASSRHRYALNDEYFELHERIASGSYGVVYRGKFGRDGSLTKIAVKYLDGGTKREANSEVVLQTTLFCLFREQAAKYRHERQTSTASPITNLFVTAQPPKSIFNMAKIPKPYFAAEYKRPKKGADRFIGMESLDYDLIDYVERTGVAALPGLVRQVACLLLFLQERLQFQHGDLHGENVMIKATNPPVAYLIDFGMSTYQIGKRARTSAGAGRYTRDTPMNPCLDLLMLLTFCQEVLGRRDGADCKAASRWCANIVLPFWNSIKNRLRNGGGDDPEFSSTEVIRKAKQYGSGIDSTTFAHHMLYQYAALVRYPTTPLDIIVYIDNHRYGGTPPATVDGWNAAGIFRREAVATAQPATSALLLVASIKGDVDEVRRCLKDPSVDVNFDTSGANPLASASSNGHASIVEILLSDPRIEVNANNGQALWTASAEGHEAVVDRLLAHPKIDVNANDGQALWLASQTGHEGVVKLLLAQRGIDVNAKGGRALVSASKEGHAAIVKLLLAHPSINRDADNGLALSVAANDRIRKMLQVEAKSLERYRATLPSVHYDDLGTFLDNPVVSDDVRPPIDDNALIEAHRAVNARSYKRQTNNIWRDIALVLGEPEAAWKTLYYRWTNLPPDVVLMPPPPTDTPAGGPLMRDFADAAGLSSEPKLAPRPPRPKSRRVR